MIDLLLDYVFSGDDIARILAGHLVVFVVFSSLVIQALFFAYVFHIKTARRNVDLAPLYFGAIAVVFSLVLFVLSISKGAQIQAAELRHLVQHEGTCVRLVRKGSELRYVELESRSYVESVTLYERDYVVEEPMEAFTVRWDLFDQVKTALEAEGYDFAALPSCAYGI